MLAELAAINSAYAVIKATIENGGELAAVGSKLGEYFGLKAEIGKKASKKGSDSEEFFALEQIKQQEAELRQMLIYQGRGGLWDDWLQFQVMKRREREEKARQERLKKIRRKEIAYNILVGILVGVIGISGVGLIGLMVYVAMNR